MSKEKIRSLVINLLIPLVVGGAAALLISQSVKQYAVWNKPPLSPPAAVFPIVWTILYILMGISAYLIMQKGDCDSTIYSFQLFINFLWPLFFFNLNAFLVALILIIILDIAVIAMIRSFFKCDKTAAYLQIPYLIWILFATYLNAGILILN